jgi:uncharacterized membrane protein
LKKACEFIGFWGICFFAYCFVGWVYEVAISYFAGFGFVNRGFLHGCYIPIYGFSALFFMLVLHKLAEKKIYLGKLMITPFLIFLSVFLLASVIEYSASYILEEYFGLFLWDYRDYKYNLNGRVCLNTSIYFGIIGLLAFYVIQPCLEALRKKIPAVATIITGFILISVILCDFIITV